MVETIGAVVPNAVGVAISPVPIIAVIAALLSRSGARNAVALTAGWCLGLVVVLVAFSMIGPITSGEPGPVAGGVKLALGVLFLVLAYRQWRTRPRPGDEPELPGWVAAIGDSSAGRAFGLGLLLSAVNPKNLGLSAAAGVELAEADLGPAGSAVVIAFFVVLGSVVMLAAVGARLAAPAQTAGALESLRTWLAANSSTVMLVLFVVLGSKLIGDGLGTLT